MKRRGVAIFSAGTLVLGICSIALSQGVPEQNTPKARTRPQPAPPPIAIATQRISRDKQTIEVFRGNQTVVIDYFTELVIATMTDNKGQPERLAGKTISLERYPKKRDQWNVFLEGGWDVQPLALPENVFRVQAVLSSTAKNQVKVQVDGRLYQLRPGEVLLLLG